MQARRARELAAAIERVFWDSRRGLYADDLEHEHWSEHAQCLAILSELLPRERVEGVGQNLLQAPDLARTTIYFSHYLFEAYRALGRVDALLERLKDWNELVENGLKTTIESPEPTRSDCHAWGAHPLFHFYATLAGIRPTAPGFARLSAWPQGEWEWLEATLPHPHGQITMEWRAGEMSVRVPDGVTFE